MKLLFIGLAPKSAVETALLGGGFSVQVTKPGDKHPPADLIVFAPKTPAAIKETALLRKHQPRAWIVLVVDKKWLKEAALQNALITCDEKDDVWTLDIWEDTLWLGIQRALRREKILAELKAAREEARTLKSLYTNLSASSDRLIRQLEKDVGLATSIQRSLLPRFSPEIPGVSLAVKYLPAAGRGGDYYDIFELADKKRLGVLIADSQTHGIVAALLSVLLKTRLEEMKDRFPDSRLFVEYLNREIQSVHGKEGARLSLLYGILDRSSLQFRFTSAGHLRPILWRKGKAESVPASGNPPLGGMDHFGFRESVLSLHPGDLVILHTDGLEAPLGEGQTAGGKAFEKIVSVLEKRSPTPDPLEVQNELMGLIDQYVERKPLADDLTLIHFAIDERALYVAGSGN